MSMRRRGDSGKDVARLAVCASDDVVRGRIEVALAGGDHEVVAFVESATELIGVWSDLDAGLVVLACELEPFAPLQEIAAVRSHITAAPIVVVAVGLLTSAVHRIVRADVQGLLHETDLEAALLPTVDSVLADQLCVPAGLREAIAQPVFSHREKQVLELVLGGLTNSEIANRLYLSESTVKSHLASSFRKLGVSSRVEAARRLLGSDAGLELGPALTTDVSTALVTPS